MIAAVIGLGLAELGVPLVNAATGLTLSISYIGWDGVLLPLLALALVVDVVAGLYPAVILARVPAAAVLAVSRSPGGGKAGSRIREGLVVFQFTITIALIVGTMVLAAQTRHVRNTDVGYDRQHLLLHFRLKTELVACFCSPAGPSARVPMRMVGGRSSKSCCPAIWLNRRPWRPVGRTSPTSRLPTS